MSPMEYTEDGKRSRRRRHGASYARGFKLKYPRRFSVQRLRAKIFYLFRFSSRWRSFYGQAVQSLKRGMSRNSSIKRCGNSKRELMMDATSCHYMEKGDEHCRFRSSERSNSFYSEAIADCLEFIKRSSISAEQKQVSPR